MKTSRNTVARSAILELISSSTIALSQPAIQHQLNGLCDRVTIYRVLERLVSDGEIHRIVNVNGVVNYASCVGCETSESDTASHQHNHEHIHFNCRVCNELTCLDQVIPHFHLPSGFTMEESFFTVSGICKNCQNHG
jgi:Fur family ferric uptake transcriptional regulator